MESAVWNSIADKAPPVNRPIFIRGVDFVGTAFFFAPKFFVTFGQTYDEEGVLSRSLIYGVTQWAVIPPLDKPVGKIPHKCATLKMSVVSLLNETLVNNSAPLDDFFPPPGWFFTILTDDNKVFIFATEWD